MVFEMVDSMVAYENSLHHCSLIASTKEFSGRCKCVFMCLKCLLNVITKHHIWNAIWLWHRCMHRHTDVFQSIKLCQLQNQSYNKCLFVKQKQMPIFKVEKIIQSREREKKTMELAIMFKDVGESILWRGNACTWADNVWNYNKLLQKKTSTKKKC